MEHLRDEGQLDALERLIELPIDSSDPWQQRVQLQGLYALGRSEEALAGLRQVEPTAQDPALSSLRAQLELREGDPQAFIQELCERLERSPDDLAVAHQLTQLVSGEERLRVVQDALAHHPDHPDLNLELALALREVEDTGAAIPVLSELDQDPATQAAACWPLLELRAHREPSSVTRERPLGRVPGPTARLFRRKDLGYDHAVWVR